MFTEYFIPYSMIASHYIVTGEHLDVCLHGKAFSEFISRLLKLSSDEQILVNYHDAQKGPCGYANVKHRNYSIQYSKTS